MESSRFLKENQNQNETDPKKVPEFSKEKVESILKNFTKYVENATKYKDALTIVELFTEHPFYRNLDVKWNPNSTIASYKIYSPKRGKWIGYNTAAFGIIDRHIKIYENIGNGIEQITNNEKNGSFIVEKSPDAIFDLE